MHTLETTAVVTADRQLVVRGPVPEDIALGEHVVLITIDPAQQTCSKQIPLFRPPYNIGVLSDNFTFRREDIYEDVDR